MRDYYIYIQKNKRVPSEKFSKRVSRLFKGENSPYHFDYSCELKNWNSMEISILEDSLLKYHHLTKHHNPRIDLLKKHGSTRTMERVNTSKRTSVESVPSFCPQSTMYIENSDSSAPVERRSGIRLSLEQPCSILFNYSSNINGGFSPLVSPINKPQLASRKNTCRSKEINIPGQIDYN